MSNSIVQQPNQPVQVVQEQIVQPQLQQQPEVQPAVIQVEQQQVVDVNVQPQPQQQEKDKTSSLAKLGIKIDRENKRVCKELDNGGQLIVGLDQAHMKMANHLINGQLPSNIDIDQSVEQWKRTINAHSVNLSAQGKKIANDMNELLDSMNKAFVSKNKDDMWQKYISEANLFRKEVVQESVKKEASELKSEMNAEQLKEQARVEAKEFYDNLQGIVLFILRSKEFRELLLDSFSLLQSMARRFDRQYGDRITESIRNDLLIQDQQKITSVVSTESDRISVSLQSEASQDPAVVSVQQQPSAVKSLGSELLNIQNTRKQLVDDRELQAMEEKLKSIIDTLSRKPEYSRMITKIFFLIDKMEHMVRSKQENLQEHEKLQRAQYQRILDQTYLLIGEFTGHEEFKQLRSHVYELYDLLSKDQVARQYLLDLRKFATDCAQMPIPSSEEKNRQQQIQEFIQRGRQSFDSQKGNYNQVFAAIKDSIRKIIAHMKHDDDRKLVSKKFTNLVKNFFTDDSGKPDIFITQESLQQMKKLVSSLVNEQLHSLPLPMIQMSTDKYEVSVRNMMLNAIGLLPQHINLQSKTYIDVNNVSKKQNVPASKFVTEMNFEVDCIRMQLNNVNYAFQHKKMRLIRDSGIADVSITGDRGLSIKISWKMVMIGTSVHFELVNVKCGIDRLALKIRQAEHKMLDTIVTKLFKNVIKKKIASAIKHKIKEALTNMNNKLNHVAMEREVKLRDGVTRKSSKLVEKLNGKLKTTYDQTKDLSIQDVRQKVTKTVAEQKLKVKDGVQKVSKKAKDLAQVKPVEQPQAIDHDSSLNKSILVQDIPASSEMNGGGKTLITVVQNNSTLIVEKTA